MMDEKTRQALEGSIKKWERIAAREGLDLGIDNCPLCKLFYEFGCAGCPVSERTDRSACDGTPYHQWAQMWHADTHPEEYTDEQVKAARAELMFLESLREG